MDKAQTEADMQSLWGGLKIMLRGRQEVYAMNVPVDSEHYTGWCQTLDRFDMMRAEALREIASMRKIVR